MHIWVLGLSFEESDVKQTLITMPKVSNILDVLVSPPFIYLTHIELAELHSMAVDFPKTGDSTSDGVGPC
jgi:hypothetical protein